MIHAHQRGDAAGPPVLSIDPDWDFATLAIWRFMTWPKAQRRQDQATATWAAKMLAFRQALPSQILDGGMKLAVVLVAERLGITPAEVLSMPLARELPILLAPIADAEADAIADRVRAEVFEPAGGFQRVAEADGPAIDAELRAAVEGGAMAAGCMLLAVASLHIHHKGKVASLNRAIAILEEMTKRGGFVMPQERSLKKAWTQWGAVAPLWAAMCLDAADGHFRNLPDLEKIAGQFADPVRRRRILAWAMWLRDFAVAHVPPNINKPILAEREAARIIAPVEPQMALVGPIPADLLESVRLARGWKA